MKLNDDQRKVMQALLDGKNVSVRLCPNYEWVPVSFSHIIHVGDRETQYRIEEPAIKVALFERGGRVIAMTQEEVELNDEWTQISDWVEITPNLEK